MTPEVPVTEFDPDFSTPDATPLPWKEAEHRLQSAGVFWLSTVQPEGRPQVVPLIGVWLDRALYFATGDGGRKAKNITKEPPGNDHDRQQ